MKTLIIGIGNEFRGDDQIGLEIVKQAMERFPNENVDYVLSSGEPTHLLEKLRESDRVMIVDAVSVSEGDSGTLYEINPLSEDRFLDEFRSSTHVMGLRDALKLAEVLGDAPKSVQILGIGGSKFDFGQTASSVVLKAIPEALLRLRRWIESDESEISEH